MQCGEGAARRSALVVDAGAPAAAFVRSSLRADVSPAARRALLSSAAVFSGTVTEARAWLDSLQCAGDAPAIDAAPATAAAPAKAVAPAAAAAPAGAAAPGLARRLRAAGAAAVCLVECGATAESEPADRPLRVWVDSDQACGWLSARHAAPAEDEAGYARRYASHLAAACARGFVVADAAVLAAMACAADARSANGNSHCNASASAGALLGSSATETRRAPDAAQAPREKLADATPSGQLAAHALAHPRAETPAPPDAAAFVLNPTLLPVFSWGEMPRADAVPIAARATHRPEDRGPAAPRRLDLYAIVDNAERVLQVLAANVRTVQLRIKAPPCPDAGWNNHLRDQVQRSVAACTAAGAELFVNDHWRLAAELGAGGVHLGQEDLLALGDSGRAALQASGLALGISSHSLWELCRARTLAPRYIACGPVWPTSTKAMPWRPQGLDNLAWWCRMAGAPVVAIGGVLEAWQVQKAARCGADGVCIVRGLGDDPGRTVPTLQAALHAGRSQANVHAPATWPHSSLLAAAASGRA